MVTLHLGLGIGIQAVTQLNEFIRAIFWPFHFRINLGICQDFSLLFIVILSTEATFSESI